MITTIITICDNWLKFKRKSCCQTRESRGNLAVLNSLWRIQYEAKRDRESEWGS